MRKVLPLLFIFILISAGVHPVAAQSGGPVYYVQSGDTLSSIASRFNLTVDELMAANGLSDPNLVSVGQPLVIPGLEGLSGVLDTQVIGFGDSFRSLVRRSRVPMNLLQRLNHLVSPSELYVGVSLIVPKQDNAPQPLTIHVTPRRGETLLEMAARQGSNPWTLKTVNDLAGSWDALPGDMLYSPTGDSNQGEGRLPSAFLNTELKNLPFKQGGTAEVIVQVADGTQLGGMLVDRPLQFFPLGDGRLVALQGVHAMLEPGAYPLRLDATLPDGSTQSYEQMVLVSSGGYLSTVVNGVDPITLNPKVIDPENQFIASIVAPVTAEAYWQSPFQLPVDAQYCIKAYFGERRSYNNGSYFNFHAGVDFGICSKAKPFEIYAPAAGVVAYTGNLTICGNTTVIDHGRGVHSRFCHQAEMYVTPGERVSAGQLIGKIGGTGRSNGPHLHWELWVNGVQVNALDWLETDYP